MMVANAHRLKLSGKATRLEGRRRDSCVILAAWGHEVRQRSHYLDVQGDEL